MDFPELIQFLKIILFSHLDNRNITYPVCFHPIFQYYRIRYPFYVSNISSHILFNLCWRHKIYVLTSSSYHFDSVHFMVLSRCKLLIIFSRYWCLYIPDVKTISFCGFGWEAKINDNWMIVICCNVKYIWLYGLLCESYELLLPRITEVLPIWVLHPI